MVIKAADYRTALKKKGFQQDRNTSDEIYYFYCDGKKTSIHTKVSMGKGEDLRDARIGQIKRQLRLDTSLELGRFVDCPLTHEQYIEHLKARGHIEC